jgi:hypothetical protein
MNKKRRCRECKKYKVANSMKIIHGGAYCDIECAIKYAYKTKEQGAKIKHTAQKKELKENDKAFRFKQAQMAFNAFIRKRDESLPCISCQRHHKGQYHAGHYKSVGARSDLRFNEDNCHKQCAPCNNHLSGNIGEYLPNLIKKIGASNVHVLDYVKITKYTCAELMLIERRYKCKIKELQ